MSEIAVIRPMCASDACRLADAFAGMRKTAGQFKRYWFEHSTGVRTTLVAELARQPVGYANLIWSPGYAAFRAAGIPEINDMNVVARWRCHGIGTALIGAAETEARQRGHTVLGIGFGLTPDYGIAQRLYPRLGYVPDGAGVQEDEWGGCLYLTKRLDGGLPLAEFDASPEALLEPRRLLAPLAGMPAAGVLCFFGEVIAALAAAGELVELACLRSEIGPNRLYRWSTPDGDVALLHPGVGAPLAAGFLEELLALGARAVVACGGAGVLDGALARDAVLVPTAAIRDEGTSHHYLPPAREVALQPAAVAAATDVLAAHGVPFRCVKTWTTDGIYRETAARVARRRAEGCACVEMETAALAAVAQFRGVPFAHLLYAGDDLSGATWDPRDWGQPTPVRRQLLHLAAATALALAPPGSP